MNTCKYCGQMLKSIGTREEIPYFSCSFCEMDFALQDTCIDRKRLTVVPEYFDFSNVYQTTQQFLKRDTITLYHTLKEIRAFWFSIKSILEQTKKRITEDPAIGKSYTELLDQYRTLTKKKFVVENILLERTGFLPERLTEDFLDSVIALGINASSKKMSIYIS